MEKLIMSTNDLADDKIRKIAELFPSCVTESTSDSGDTVLKVDFEELRLILGDDVFSGTGSANERYAFTWPGRKAAYRLAGLPTRKALRPCREDSLNFDNTKNIYIEGDNLDALKILREAYLGKVKLIYIDPPYNTGNDFLYNDDFSLTNSEYDEISGEFDEYGNRIVQNTGSNGRIHTDWLNMMYSRLLLARDFLTEDGAIFISIDDNEQANLKKVCDSVFNETNFVATFVWAGGRKNDSKLVSESHEYVLCYAKSKSYLTANNVKWRQKKKGLDRIYAEYDRLRKQYGGDNEAVEKGLRRWYKELSPNDDAKNHKHYNRVDDKGIFFPGDISWPGGGGPKYTVLHPITGKAVKTPSRGWLYSEEVLKKRIEDDLICFGDDETSVPTDKKYLRDHEYSAPYSVFYNDGRAATKRLRNLMNDDVFQNPKDELIIQSIIEFATDEDSIVMDFFSGSATTAHAVFLQNLADSGRRSFILVQIPEPIRNLSGSSESSKKVKTNAEKLLGDKPQNICEIGLERIRRSGKEVFTPQTRIDGYRPDVGFRVFKIDSSNMRDVYYNPKETSKSILDYATDSVKPDRTSEDVLFQIMLELGILPSAKIDILQLADRPVFNVDDGYLLAFLEPELDDRLVEEIAKISPRYAAFRDSSLSSDSTAINIREIFKTHSPETEIRILRGR